jgi:hypothetical protein
MLEKQVDHRIELESSVIRAEIRRAYRGIAAGLAIALTGIGTSTYVIMSGHDVVGGVLGGSTLIALVGTFVYGTNSRRGERTEKAKVMAGLNSSAKRGT